MFKKLIEKIMPSEEAKLQKKLLSMKKEYESLDSKFTLGKITKVELDRYYALKEEIDTMAKKFILKDGKLVLNKEDAPTTEMDMQSAQVGQNVEPKQVEQPKKMEAPVAPSKVVKPVVVEPPVMPQNKEINEKVYNDLKREEEEQQEYLKYLEQKRAQDQRLLEERQAYEYEQYMLKQRALEEHAHMQRQQMQETVGPAPNQSNPAVEENIYRIFIFVSDLPEIPVDVQEKNVETFISNINKAMTEKLPFNIGPMTINGDKILMYRIE